MNMTEILNTIRDNASTTYQDRIPTATKTNIADIGAILVEDAVSQNEFCSSLINRIALVLIQNKRFTDPLSILKKGNIPMGETVEEIFVNYAKGENFDASGADLLERKLPDVKAIYHKMNSQRKYKVTIGPEQLMLAFKSESNFQSFLNQIVNSLYNGDELDEFILFKKLISQAIENNMCKTLTLDSDPITSGNNATAFIKAVKTVSALMPFPSEEYNGYLDSQDSDDIPVRTFTSLPDQVIIIDVPTSVSIDVDVLAKAFNMSKQEFLAKQIVIDSFEDNKTRAVLCDINWSQVRDLLYTQRDFENGEGLYVNYIVHHWQSFSVSSLCNAVAFQAPITEHTITYTLDEFVKSTNKITKKVNNSSFTTTISIDPDYTSTLEIDSVTVTMGGTDITSTAYTSSTGKISISSVTGNVVITVTKKIKTT